MELTQVEIVLSFVFAVHGHSTSANPREGKGRTWGKKKIGAEGGI
jgi:hypothetical protein